jgi:hypothetical protein
MFLYVLCRICVRLIIFEDVSLRSYLAEEQQALLEVSPIATHRRSVADLNYSELLSSHELSERRIALDERKQIHAETIFAHHKQVSQDRSVEERKQHHVEQIFIQSLQMYESNPEVYMKNRLCVFIATTNDYPYNPTGSP